MALDDNSSRAARDSDKVASSLNDAQASSNKLDKLWSGLAKHWPQIKQNLNETLGPLGIAISLSFKFLAGLQAVLAASQLINRSLQSFAQVQYYTPSFAKMLGGLSEARTRLNDLVRMSSKGPFQFADLVQGNKRLEILTRGLFSSKEAMMKVQDSAAAAGSSVEAAGGAIGETFKAIENHEGVDGAVKSLGEMGIISVSTADELRNLANTGASNEQMFYALDGALSKNKGSAQALNETLYGLSQQMASVKEANLSGIGELFSEGKAAGMRAGLTILQSYGPVLTDLMRPVAGLYNAWNKLVLGFAQIASMGAVTATLKGLFTLLVSLGAAFSIKGLGILVRDIAGLAGWLIRLAVPSAAAATGLGLVGRATLLLGRSLIASLGPLGLAVAGLTALSELMGAFGDSDSKKFGVSISKSADDISDTNNHVRSIVEAATGSGDIGQKGEAVSAAAEAWDQARKAKSDAAMRQNAGGGWGIASSIGTGFASGAILGSFLGVPGAVAGGVLGAGIGAVTSYNQAQKDAAARLQLESLESAAKSSYDQALKSRALTPSQYLNDPDYARAQAEGQQKLSELAAKRRGYTSSGGGDNDAFVKKIDEEMKAISAGVSPEALKKSFDIRMSQTGARAQGLRAIGQATGDKSKMLQADKLEAGMQRDELAKQYRSQGIDGAQADRMAATVSLSSQLDVLRTQGIVHASSRASVGLAMSEATGGVDQTIKRILETIQRIENEQGNGNNISKQGMLSEQLAQ